jgi:hypothetical protein
MDKTGRYLSNALIFILSGPPGRNTFHPGPASAGMRAKAAIDQNVWNFGASADFSPKPSAIAS